MGETGNSTDSAEAAAFWRAAFEGVWPQESLPQDRKTPQGCAGKPAWLDEVISADLAGRLRLVAAAAECALAQLCLAAFHALLFRYSGTSEILVAWHLHGEPLVILPVRTSLSADRSFLQLVGEVRSACVLGRLRGGLSVDLIPAALRWQGEERLPVRFRASESGAAPGMSLAGELSLWVTETPDGAVWARFFYNAQRYQPRFIQAMARHYCRLMDVVSAHPASALGELELATPEEEALLRAWSFGPDAPAVPDLQHLRFQEHAGRNPDKAAVVFSGGALSYAELDAGANRMARFLQGLGVGPDVPVGIFLRRSPELVMAYLGVIKAGGAIFLLDAGTPAERMRAALEVVSPAVVLTENPFDKRVAQTRWPNLCLSEIAAELASQQSTAPANRVTPGHTASVMTTSGSTGAPKIMRKRIGRHRPGIGYELPGIAPMSPDDRHLLKTDSGTGFTHAEILRPLMSGGTLFVAPEGLEYDPAKLAEFIDEHRISCLLATPSQLSAFLNSGELRSCPSLRIVECIGETVSTELKRRFFERLKQCELVISYGCSEAPSATGRVCSPLDDDPAIVDVGRPTPLMEVFVLDPRLRMSPIGVPGEVYLGGELVEGYVNDPAETAERFIPHVFGRPPGARLFRTGDRGRWLPGGNLEILGRRDTQVKVRGFRIELKEIETRLAEHAGVSRCAVVLQENDQGDKQLLACWVAQGQTVPTPSGLRGHLRATLPEYMLPSRFVRLESMPLTSNGKTDRRALAAMEELRPVLDTPYAAPRNQVEEQLALIWSEVFAIPQVGIFDDFFALGGHSLMATQLLSRIRAVFGLDVTLRLLFDYPTIEGLGQAIVRQAATTGPDRNA